MTLDRLRADHRGHSTSSVGAHHEGRWAQGDGLPISANPYKTSKCPGHGRHWFTGWGGGPTLFCTRCRAPRQTATEARLAGHWRAGWLALVRPEVGKETC